MAKAKKPAGGKSFVSADKKQADLSPDIETGANEFMTTDQGLKINDDQNSLKAGERGGTLLEEFYFKGKDYPLRS